MDEIKNFGGIFSINALERKIFGKIVTEGSYDWEKFDYEKITTALGLSDEKEKIDFQANNHGFVIKFADEKPSNYQITDNSAKIQKTQMQEYEQITGSHISPDVTIRNALFTSTIDSEKEKIILKEHLEKLQINENTFLVIRQAMGPGRNGTIAMEYDQKNEHRVIIKVIIEDNNDSMEDIKKCMRQVWLQVWRNRFLWKIKNWKQCFEKLCRVCNFRKKMAFSFFKSMCRLQKE